MSAATHTLPEPVAEELRRAGNPFRNYFARSPDDEVCARYHVPELFARERELLHQVIDLYRYAPTTHSEVIPVLGSKGSGKTHLLHSIKHGPEGAWQLLVTPGTYQRDTEFLEYLLFQVIDTLLGGGKQKNTRPLDFVGELLVREVLGAALNGLPGQQRLDLFPAPALGGIGRWLGLGGTQAQERTQWLIDSLKKPITLPLLPGGIARACDEAGLEPARACELIVEHVQRTEPHNTKGLMRRHILEGFARAVLLRDEADLASFLTYGFAELEFQVRPTRQDLVLALFKALMGILQELHIPVVVAFDQLEDLLLARRSDDVHRTAEAFFAGIVQAMHHLDGLNFLIFAERGLWNRFVPSLDGYIQDRLNNPVHLPGHGTFQALRLEAPEPELVKRIVEARLRSGLEEFAEEGGLDPLFPFTWEQVEQVARTEPTLRDMLQQFRHLFDHLVYGASASTTEPTTPYPSETPTGPLPEGVKSLVVMHSPEPAATPAPPAPVAPRGTDAGGASLGMSFEALSELWDQEVRSARRKLEPVGGSWTSVTGATRELQSGLGSFLRTCQDHGVKVGPWRLHHVVDEWTFGEHPTYGVMTIAHWVCKDGQPWKVGIGLFLGRASAKPRDLDIKLTALDMEPAVIDHLILLRPEDDFNLTGKSKALWQEAERRGRHARLEPTSLDAFAILYGFPRILAHLMESLPQGQACIERSCPAELVPRLADLIQEKCEKLLEQVCMPVQS
jgi:hypothetical protein